MSYDLEDKRAWITGASSGIGRAMAVELASRGCRLALSARSEDDLHEMAGELSNTETLVVPLDVTQPEANHEACARIGEDLDGLDLAIFNAGTCEYVDAEAFEADLFDRVFSVNLLGMTRGIEAALPLLEQSEDPYLIGMSSASAYLSLPRAEAYGASKSAVKYLMESLRYDLEPRDMSVSVVCPGFVKTPLTEENDFPMPFLMEADEAAEVIADGIESETPEIHFPKRLTLTMKALSLLPGWLLRPLIRQFVKRS